MSSLRIECADGCLLAGDAVSFSLSPLRMLQLVLLRVFFSFAQPEFSQVNMTPSLITSRS